MNRIFASVIGVYVTAYVDDILVYSDSFADQCVHTREVFRLLDENNLHVKESKLELFKKKVLYCGYMVDGHGVWPTDASKEEVARTERPRSVKELQSFLGMMNYFRQFIPDFARRQRDCQSW